MKEFNYSLLLPFISFTTDSFIIIFFHYGLRISNHIYTDKYGYLPPFICGGILISPPLLW